MGLGSVGAFTLAEARERARLQRQRLADGIDPIDHRRAVQAETAMAKAQAVPFEDCAQRYIDSRRAGWKTLSTQTNGARPFAPGPIRSSVSCRLEASRPISSCRYSNSGWARGARLRRSGTPRPDGRPGAGPHREHSGLGHGTQAAARRQPGTVEGASGQAAAGQVAGCANRTAPGLAVQPASRIHERLAQA